MSNCRCIINRLEQLLQFEMLQTWANGHMACFARKKSTWLAKMLTFRALWTREWNASLWDWLTDVLMLQIRKENRFVGFCKICQADPPASAFATSVKIRFKYCRRLALSVCNSAEPLTCQFIEPHTHAHNFSFKWNLCHLNAVQVLTDDIIFQSWYKVSLDKM